MSDEAFPYLIVGVYFLGVIIKNLICFYFMIKKNTHLLDVSWYSFDDLAPYLKGGPDDHWIYSKFVSWTWPLIPLYFILFGLCNVLSHLSDSIKSYLLKAMKSHFKK